MKINRCSASPRTVATWFRLQGKLNWFPVALRSIDSLKKFDRFTTLSTRNRRIAARHDRPQKFGYLEFVIVVDGIHAEEQISVFLLPRFQQSFFSRNCP